MYSGEFRVLMAVLFVLVRLLCGWSVSRGSCLGPRKLLPDSTVPQTADPGTPHHESHPHRGSPPQAPEHLQDPRVRDIREEERYGSGARV